MPYLAAAALAVSAFALYLATIAPGITWSNLGADGGDLLSASFTWGIPHPSGYPSYLILLRAFSAVVPVGEPAFRANLMSATFAALAVGFLFLAATRAISILSTSQSATPRPDQSSRAPGLVVLASAAVAAAGAGAARELWSQATITEVYALNAFFVAAILAGCVALLVRQDTERVRALSIGALAFVFGFGLGNHLTLGLAAGPLLVAVMYRQWKDGIDPRGMLLVGALFVLGSAVYVYAPIASLARPGVNWGHPHTAEGFWWMVSGSIYQDYAFGVEPALIPGRIATWADFFLSQYTVVGLWLGLAGLYALWSRIRALAVATIASVLLVSAYAIGYDTPDSYLYLIPAFLIFALWIAAGIAWTAAELIKYLGSKRRRSTASIAVASLIAIATIALPGFSVYANAAKLNLRDDQAARRFASAALEDAGAGAVILADDAERVFPLWYQTYVAHPDSGVAVVSLPHLQFDWYWEDLTRQFSDRVPSLPPGGFDARVDALVAHNLGVNPIFAASRTRLLDRHRLVEEGVLFRIDETR